MSFPFRICKSDLHLIRFEQFEKSNLKLLEHFILNGLTDQFHFESKHNSKKLEYLISRSQASYLYKKMTQKNCYYFPNSTDRSPIFPSDVVGSFSHSLDLVCTAMALKNSVHSVGVDVEHFGRFKPEMDRMIKNEFDLDRAEGFSEVDLSTLIFSAKECLYKALFPDVKIFFGFADAALIDLSEELRLLDQLCGFEVKKSGIFKIKLLTNLNESYVKDSIFIGEWVRFDNFILTIIEIKK